MKTSLSTSSSETGNRVGLIDWIGRVALFIALFAGFYVASIYVLANLEGRAAELLRVPSNVPMGVPPPGDSSLFRLRELDDQRDVDILFLGSSHAYRSFDVRIYARRGLQTFNMGSTSQTPLNAYYLLRSRIDRLRPKLVVVETFWLTLESDGAESFLDLLANRPPDEMLARMALATRNLEALNAFLARSFDRNATPAEQLTSRMTEANQYVPGGYVQRAEGVRGREIPIPERLEPSRRQLGFLRRLIRLSREIGSKVVLVVQPLPEATMARIENYDEAGSTMLRFAERNEVEFLDFNLLMPQLEDDAFYDNHHLNQRGVVTFNAWLEEELRAHDLWP